MRIQNDSFCLRPGLRVLAALCGGIGLVGPAWGESFQLGPVEAQYKITLNYAMSMRIEDQEQALINGPVEEMYTENGSDGQTKFYGTGLPNTINADDANRNFQKNSLLNNRASAFSEMQFTWGSYGAIFSGAGFYDQVFQEENDNTSPDTVNKDGTHNEFTEDARLTSGEKTRLLEAYGYADWWFGETMSLNVRAGKHLTAWGESLFFPGVVSAQGPFDATKAFVPGAEIKEILLPVNQIGLQMGITGDLSLLGFYQFEFKPTEIFPAGDFFSPADLVGPGGTFAYGSINPTKGEGCAGLFGPASPLCDNGGVSGELTDAPDYILVTREPDILPKKKDKPWGLGLKYQVTPVTNLGAYYLKYHNHNPGVRLNLGYAVFGYNRVTGEPITSEQLNQRVPVTYNITYADNIEMKALSFTTVLWSVNVAGEYIQRENVDVPVQAIMSKALVPVFQRGKTTQALLSFLYAVNPKFLFYDEIAAVGEFGWLRIDEATPVQAEDGVEPVGDGQQPFYDRESWAFQLLFLPKGRNVLNGWDLGTPISFAWDVKGNPGTPGAFGGLAGEGDQRFSVGLSMQYLQNLEFTTTYNGFLGDPEKQVRSSVVKANPYVDHDYVSFTVKYNL